MAAWEGAYGYTRAGWSWKKALKRVVKNYTGGRMVKNLPAIAEGMGLIPGLEGSNMPQGN